MRFGRFSSYHENVRKLLIAGLVLVSTLPAQRPQSLQDEGYNHFYNLEYEQAIAVFEKMIAIDPSSPEAHNHLAQTLVFQEMFRDGALESELVSGDNSFLRRPKLNPSAETERRFLAEIDRALTLSQQRLKANPDDTGALYAEGIAYGLRSNYYWVVKKAWQSSLRDATAARRLHNHVSDVEPANVDARLVQGLHDYIVGSLPLFYRMLGFLAGIHGDKEKGIRTVQEVARAGKTNGIDAEVLLCALYRRENQPRSAIPLIQDLIRRFPRNYLLRMELAQMYSQAGDKGQALAAMQEIARLKRERTPGFDRLPWEKIWFQTGVVEFWYNDLDRALENLQKVAAASQDIDLNTGVTAYLRIGQIYDLTNRRPQALEAYKHAIAYAPEADAAQQSRKYLAEPYRRQKM
jgi:tetratricopeptide (TPR) repeat protein